MNSAIGPNIQLAAPAVAGQSVPLEGSVLPHTCVDGSCVKQGDKGFLKVLNAELAALSEDESLDFFTLVKIDDQGGVEDLTDLTVVDDVAELSIPLALLPDYLKQLEEVPSDNLNLTKLTENIDIETLPPELKDLFNEALSELPKKVIALPLTEENQQFIKQQAFELMRQKNPEVAIQLEQFKTEMMPLNLTTVAVNVAETTIKEQSLSTLPSLTVAAATMVKGDMPKDVSLVAKDSSEFVANTEADTDIDLSFKELMPKNESEELKEKLTFENLIAKNSTQSEAPPPKFTLEAVSTVANNVMGANHASINTPTAAAAQSAGTLHLPQNPSPEQWGSALGDKVQFMINSKLQSADLRIDPPHLGKIDISIKMTDDGASVVIQTQHAATRELIDAASYRLKEMLEEAGHKQVDVDVSHKEHNESDSLLADNEQTNNVQNEGLEEDDISTSDLIAGSTTFERPGLDLFA